MTRYLMVMLAGLLLWHVPAGAEEAWQAQVRETVGNHDLHRARAQVEAVLRVRPGDPAARLWQARIDALLNDHARSRSRFDALIADYPDDVDVRFASAQQYAWQGDNEAALEELAVARAQAPDYASVWAFELQVLQARARETRDPDHVEAYAQRHREARAQVPEVAGAWPDEALPPFTWRRRRVLDIGYEEDYLTGDRDDWRGADIGLQWQDSHDRLWYTRARHTRRFDQDDLEGNVGVYLPMGRQRQLQLDATYSDTARIRPEWSAYAGFYWMPRARWGLQPGVRRTHYESSDSTTASLLTEHYRGQWRYAYTFFFTRLDGGGSAPAHVLDARRYYRDTSHVGAGLGYGKDIESLPQGVLVTDVVGISVFGEHFLDPDWSVTWRLGWTEQGDLYERTGCRLGLRYRF